MDEHFRFTGRATSASAATRRNERTTTQRGGFTSPSADSSSDSDGGGAPLYDDGASLAQNENASVAAGEDTSADAISGAGLATGISALNMGRSSGNTYLPPHLRGPRDEAPGQMLRSGSNFQLGNAPTDGDVFGDSNAQDATLLQDDRISGHLHLNLPDRTRNQMGSVHGTNGSIDTNMQLTQTSGAFRRNVTHGAMLGSPERRETGAIARSSSSNMITASRSSGNLAHSESRHQVGGVDAQAFYSPGACVFVANLPESVEDTHLEAEVTRAFSEYGTVFVKIRRDARNMPFAFCQFTSEADAKVAMVQGKGRMIFGRACRTEPVRANRTYIMHRTNGDDMYADEAREALADRGFHPLEKCEMLPYEIQKQQGMSRSVLVKLKKFDPSKELQGAFRNHVRYRVIPFDEQKGAQVTKLDPAEVWLQRYEVDRRSIFIGDLPFGLPRLEERLRDYLAEFGEIADMQMVSREPRDGRTPICFAFVEFARPDMAAIAVDRLRHRQLFGHSVRVERKVCREAISGRGAPRFNAARGRSYQSPSADRGHRRYDSYQSPQTPLRRDDAIPRRIAGPDAAAVAASRFEWSSPTLGTNINYTTSPYPDSERTVMPSSAYDPASPQMAGHYAAQSMMHPMSPQVPTPYGAHMAANQMTPYGAYASQYAWMSPYLADPHYAPYAIAHIANEVNQANQAQAHQAGNNAGEAPAGGADAGGNAQIARGSNQEHDQEPDTPTRIARARHGRRDGNSGDNA
ncbi:hypothetical protein BJ166DRAFT_616740 [Pestalotiopsis sp. NC0098]|nr:hypothetical protein BJ166DRAFT_616740 [Pestalotiopsis sp. NC0098]